MNTDRINGWGVIFRFITPLMIGVTLAMITYILSDIRGMRESLDNHLKSDVVEIRERLMRIETMIGG